MNEFRNRHEPGKQTQRQANNTTEHTMKNWKTTLIGAVLAGLAFLAMYQSSGGDLNKWQQWLIPALIAAIGYVAKDAGVTGGLKVLGLLLMCGWLVSCAGMTKEQWMVIGKGVLLREAPVVYGEIQQARALTSAKEPVGVVNP